MPCRYQNKANCHGNQLPPNFKLFKAERYTITLALFRLPFYNPYTIKPKTSRVQPHTVCNLAASNLFEEIPWNQI